MPNCTNKLSINLLSLFLINLKINDLELLFELISTKFIGIFLPVEIIWLVIILLLILLFLLTFENITPVICELGFLFDLIEILSLDFLLLYSFIA